MKVKGTGLLLAGVGVATLLATAIGSAQAPAAPAAGQAAGGRAGGGGGRGGGAAGGGIAPDLFSRADMNRDGAVTRAELMSTMEHWFGDADAARAGSVTAVQLSTVLAAFFPAPAAPPAANCGTGIAVPCPQHLTAMRAALPEKAYAKPAKPRRLLIYGVNNQTPSHGFVHSSIAIQSYTLKEMGEKLGTWSTDISYNPADINTENLKKYDAILLDSTTGCFLDQPGDKAATDARRAALLAFVRGGKGLMGIHASTDSYHGTCPNDAPVAGAAARGGGGGGRGAAAAGPAVAAGPGGQLATTIVTQADKNTDQKVTLAEVTGLVNEWFDKMDTDKSGRVAQADFAARYAAAQPAAAAGGRGGAPAAGGRGAGAGGNAGAVPVARGSTKQPAASASWPEWTKVIGGYFKFHWVNGTHIPVKVDDPKSPLTVMLDPKGFEVIDETYTFAQDSFSRTNVHVLTSVDYDKMPQATKDQEPAATARSDGDYALSYIRREGNGRVFYEATGHDESIYARKDIVAHYLAGMQYVMGDLKADDSPSVKAKK